jgi:hypothetical protein
VYKHCCLNQNHIVLSLEVIVLAVGCCGGRDVVIMGVLNTALCLLPECVIRLSV